MSEIEDIFASKGKAEALPTQNYHASASKVTSKAEKKKKKRQKSAVPSSDSSKTQHTESVVLLKKRQLPETVVDTSHAPHKRQKQKHTEVAENSAFQDSRGTSGGSKLLRLSLFRYIHRLKLTTEKRTEEGWLVYKEDELGINDTGGGKLPNMFNCSLFTTPSNQTLHCVHLTVIVVSFLSQQSDIRIKEFCRLLKSI